MAIKKYFVGKHSIVSNAEIGEGSKIWHFCNIYGCKIGRNTQVGSYSEIKTGAVVGDNCRLQSYVFIPESTIVGNNVFMGPRVTVLNDKYPTAQKAIDKTWTLEEVFIEEDVTIGGEAVILPGVRIGRRAFIGAGSIVARDVPRGAVVYGCPAIVKGKVGDEKYRRRLR